MNIRELSRDELIKELDELQKKYRSLEDLLTKDKHDREKVENALRESEENYRTLIQYSSDPIFCFNPDETYRFVNETFALHFGKTPKEIIGKTPHFIFPFEEAEKRLTLVRQVFKTKQRGEIEVKVNAFNGDVKYFITLVDPVKDDQDNILWVSCISKDITERKLTELKMQRQNEELIELNATKDKLFSIISHDLKSPFNSLLGFSQLMIENIDDFGKEKILEYTNYINGTARQAFTLLENLLEWARLQQGMMEPTLLRHNLKGIVDEVVLLFNENARNKNIIIQNNIHTDFYVNCDRDMTQAIMRNLISNAVKFTQRSGIVSILAKTNDSQLEIQIIDNGVGIPKDKMPYLFKIITTYTTKGTADEKGTGLGLLLSKELIEKQGGMLFVESQVGKGSVFKFTLPLAYQHE